jgi:hypothetical protein
LKDYSVEHRPNASYHPQANPSERTMKVIGASLRALVDEDQTKWPEHVPLIAFAINTAIHESTKFSPYHVNFGREMITRGTDWKSMCLDDQMDDTERFKYMQWVKGKVRQHVKLAFARYSKHYNLRTRAIEFRAGDFVWRRNFRQSSKADKYSSKLRSKFIKSRIVRKIGNSSYEVQDVDGKYAGIFHTKDLKLIVTTLPVI